MPGNRIIDALPRDERQRLEPHLQRAHLRKSKVIYEIGDPVTEAYFPVSGMLSLLAVTDEDDTVEVAMTGCEGMSGLPIVFDAETSPYRVMVQIAGEALRIKAEALRAEFRRGGALQRALLRYTHSLLAQVAQSAACHRFHATPQRLSRWLLVARDRIDSDTLDLTQEFLAHMLGIRRAGVNDAAIELQDAGVIRYRYGRITIVDRRRLEMMACECYRVVQEMTGESLVSSLR